MGIRVRNQDEFIINLDKTGAAAATDKYTFRAPFAGSLVAHAMGARVAGTTGSMISDFLIQGVSAYTTAANRPTLTTGLDAEVVAASIDGVRTFAKGALLQITIPTVHTTPATDVSVTAVLRRTGPPTEWGR